MRKCNELPTDFTKEALGNQRDTSVLKSVKTQQRFGLTETTAGWLTVVSFRLSCIVYHLSFRHTVIPAAFILTSQNDILKKTKNKH